MGVRQTGVGLDGDLISRRLIHIDLDQRKLLDLDPGDLLHLALFHKSGHLSVVEDGLVELVEHVLFLILLKYPHEPTLTVVPDLLDVIHRKEAFREAKHFEKLDGLLLADIVPLVDL
uniref:Uncharacterized protein n=1 Tax=Triticum urartu TaxID=4572 RepID=A0A8R7UJ44_TRIUA